MKKIKGIYLKKKLKMKCQQKWGMKSTIKRLRLHTAKNVKEESREEKQARRAKWRLLAECEKEKKRKKKKRNRIWTFVVTGWWANSTSSVSAGTCAGASARGMRQEPFGDGRHTDQRKKNASGCWAAATTFNNGGHPRKNTHALAIDWPPALVSLLHSLGKGLTPRAKRGRKKRTTIWKTIVTSRVFEAQQERKTRQILCDICIYLLAAAVAAI